MLRLWQALLVLQLTFCLGARTDKFTLLARNSFRLNEVPTTQPSSFPVAEVSQQPSVITRSSAPIAVAPVAEPTANADVTPAPIAVAPVAEPTANADVTSTPSAAPIAVAPVAEPTANADVTIAPVAVAPVAEPTANADVTSTPSATPIALSPIADPVSSNSPSMSPVSSILSLAPVASVTSFPSRAPVVEVPSTPTESPTRQEREIYYHQTFRGDFLRYPLVNSTAFHDSIRNAVNDILGAPKGSVMNYFSSEDCRFPSTGVYRCILIIYSTNANYESTVTKVATAFETDPKYSMNSRLVSTNNDYASLVSASVGVPVTVTSYQIANPTFSPTASPVDPYSLLRNKEISKGVNETDLIVGLVIGVPFALILCVGLCFCCYANYYPVGTKAVRVRAKGADEEDGYMSSSKSEEKSNSSESSDERKEESDEDSESKSGSGSSRSGSRSNSDSGRSGSGSDRSGTGSGRSSEGRAQSSKSSRQL